MSARKTTIRAAATPPPGTGRVWVVVDATPDSTIGDVCFETDAVAYIAQVRGGLGEDRHPRFHPDLDEAEADATARIVAARAAAAIARATYISLDKAARVEVRDAQGGLLYAAEIEAPR